MSVAPIRFRHGLLPLLGYPRGSGLRQAFSVADGYDLALVSAFRVTIAPRRADASAPWVGSIAAADAFAARVFTLDFADDAVSDDDDTLELSAITAEKNCLWAVDALNADGELEWRLQGDLRFASPYGADGGETAAIGAEISLAITEGDAIAITILGNSAAGSIDGAALAELIHGATEKESIADDDEIAGADSAASYGLKRWKWSTVKAWVNGLISTAIAALNLGNAATKNVGTSAGNVAAGNDSRFSNARTPTAHKSSHAAGGADALSPADIGAYGAGDDATFGAVTVTSLEVGDAESIGAMVDHWDDSGTVYDAISMDVDDDASAAASRVLHLLKNGATVIAVRKDGQLTTTANILVGNGVLIKNLVDQIFFYFDWGNTLLCYQNFQPDSSGSRDLGTTGRRWRRQWIDSTVTAVGTTGAQTINKAAGSVNFAAAASSLVVTNSLVSTDSIITCTVRTNDATMKTVVAVGGAGSFTLYPNASPTGEVRVDFVILN